MTTIGPIILAGFVGAYLSAFGAGTASSHKIIDRSRPTADRHAANLGILANKGNFYCGLTRYFGIDRATVEFSTLSQRVIAFLNTWHDDESEIGIHQSVLDGIIAKSDFRITGGPTDRDGYIRLRGRKITPSNDRIVANFQNNSAAQVDQRNRVSAAASAKFSGYKALLGRQTRQNEHGRPVEVDIHFRIIFDWNYETPRARELSVHRAAYVISETPVNAGDRPGREMFYRFPPKRSPFRLLACVPTDAMKV